MSTVPTEHQEWAKRTLSVEHVSFRAFVSKFDLSDREAAIEAYYALLECSAIRNKRQRALKESFAQFRSHHEERFWAKRALEVDTEVVANRAGLKVHEAGEVMSSAAIDKFVSAIHALPAHILINEGSASTTPPGSPPSNLVSPSGNSSLPVSSVSTSVPSHDGPHDMRPEPEQLLERECEELLRSVDNSSHPHCDWKVDDACMACVFTEYRQACIRSLVARKIKRTDVSDIMAIIGIFAPSMPTDRMRRLFSPLQLETILKPQAELPDLVVDDAKIMKAVRMYLKKKGEEAEVPSIGTNKKARIMLETLLEYLPLKADITASESTFTVKCVAPIIQAYVDGDDIVSDFPNTDSVTQKQQNIKADRPDIRATAQKQELLWGEVTGPIQAGNKAKVCWDTFKLARFGKAFIMAGNDSAPLVQVVGNLGTYMNLYLKVRGVMILEEVDTFIVPTCKAMVPALVATLPTLELLKEQVKRVRGRMDGKSSVLKRSWGHQDVKDIKKRLK